MVVSPHAQVPEDYQVVVEVHLTHAVLIFHLVDPNVGDWALLALEWGGNSLLYLFYFLKTLAMSHNVQPIVV